MGPLFIQRKLKHRYIHFLNQRLSLWLNSFKIRQQNNEVMSLGICSEQKMATFLKNQFPLQCNWWHMFVPSLYFCFIWTVWICEVHQIFWTIEAEGFHHKTHHQTHLLDRWIFKKNKTHHEKKMQVICFGVHSTECAKSSFLWHESICILTLSNLFARKSTAEHRPQDPSNLLASKMVSFQVWFIYHKINIHSFLKKGGGFPIMREPPQNGEKKWKTLQNKWMICGAHPTPGKPETSKLYWLVNIWLANKDPYNGLV